MSMVLAMSKSENFRLFVLRVPENHVSYFSG